MSRKTTNDRKEITQNDDTFATNQIILEQALQYEKKIYDLEQLIDIAKSFCSTLDYSKLLESIVYICMAQMHVLGAEIFVLDIINNDNLYLETAKVRGSEKVAIPANSPLAKKLLTLNRPVTFDELKTVVRKSKYLDILKMLSPTLIVPLTQKNHLNGILVLQERIAIEDDTSYSEYEQTQIKAIASLASVAINNAALLEIASTDMMTHLRLKYYFYNVLTEAIDNAKTEEKSLTVMMFDIDFFKKFNDTYGHECGDFVLTEVANLIKSNLRDTDVASRYGGEEFTVLLYKTKKTEAMKIARRIKNAIEEYDFVYGTEHFHVTISGGVSVFDGKVDKIGSPNQLVDQADKALYVSKNKGRNRVTLYSKEAKMVANKNVQ